MAERLGDILKIQLRRHHIDEPVQAAQIVMIFQQVLKEHFPESLARRITPLFAREKVLTLKVESSSVSQECKFHETILLKKLHEKLPHAGIARLSFTH